MQTYEYWLDLMKREKQEGKKVKEQGGVRLPLSGLKVSERSAFVSLKFTRSNTALLQQIDSYEFWDNSLDYDIWYAPHVEAFRQLSPSHLPISKINHRASPGAPEISHGAYYKAMSINVPQYLLYLSEKAKSHGVEVLKARLDTTKGFPNALREAEELVTDLQSSKSSTKPSCFINATGLGARALCDDTAIYPVRGQTVLVKGEAHSTITRAGEGYRAYCIPRPESGTTILGGTKEEGVWESEPDDNATEEILRRNAWQVPELLTGPGGEFEVLSVQCGLRPARTGGPRVEGEVVGGMYNVVHAYGHAGAGYQNSIGSARKVVGLVGEGVAAAAVVQGRQAKL